MRRFLFLALLILTLLRPALLVLLLLVLLAIPLPAQTFTPIRVHCGAALPYTDSNGNTWAADNSFSGGSVYQDSLVATGTKDPALYQSLRQATSGKFSYIFTVPNGTYTLNLLFDDFWSSTGRTQNVFVNGTLVLSKLSAAIGAANIQSFPVTVTGGSINIEFDQVSYPAFVNAIEILPAAPPACPPASNLTFTVNATLSWDDATPTAPDPVLGFVISDQTDCNNTFGATQTNAINSDGSVLISKAVNVQPQFITLRFTLQDTSGNFVPGGSIQQTIPSQMLAAVPTGTYAASIVLVKGSNPVVVKSLSVSP